MSEPSPRHIYLCADDYGISPGVNRAIRDLIALGRINATSVMMVAPSLQPDETAALLEASGGRVAIGLHMTLTAPFKPLGHGFAPLRGGAFLSLGAMLQRSHLRRLKPELLTIEIERQFQTFASAFGRPPDFVDGHQHVHLLPQVREALLRVARKAAPNAWVRQCGRAGAAPRGGVDVKARVLDGFSRRFRRVADALHVQTNPAFAGAYAFRDDADYGALFPSFLSGIPDGGVIMCHPGLVDAELKRLDPLTDLREREYAFFRGDTFPRLLASHGIALAAGPNHA